MKKTVLMLVVSIVAVPVFAGSAKNAVSPVATIGNITVSEAELEEAVGTKLARLQTEIYNVRRSVLDELIAKKVLEAEAARRGVSVDELLQTEVREKVTAPDLTELDRVWEGVADRYAGMSKEQAFAEISKSSIEHRVQLRKYEFVRELRDAAGVRVNIAPPRVAVKAEGPSRGNAEAPVTIVIFSDFECQFCGRAVDTLKKVEEKYGQDVRIVFRDYPLEFHRTAKRASEAAQCANEQGKFWEMHDKLFSKGGPIYDSDIYRFAQQIGLEHNRFDACLTTGKFKDAWKPGLSEGDRLGVQSTPTFFVNGRLIVGAAPLEQFSRIIDDELAQAKTQKAGTKVAAR